MFLAISGLYKITGAFWSTRGQYQTRSKHCNDWFSISLCCSGWCDLERGFRGGIGALRCGLLLQCGLSVCLSLCLLVTIVSPAKTDEAIETLFEICTRIPKKPYCVGALMPPRRGALRMGVIFGHVQTCRWSIFLTLLASNCGGLRLPGFCSDLLITGYQTNVCYVFWRWRQKPPVNPDSPKKFEGILSEKLFDEKLQKRLEKVKAV